MTIFVNNTEERTEEVMGHIPPHEHKGPAKHIPPHERAKLLPVKYDDDDIELLTDVFGDADTAEAAAMIIQMAPPEIRILAIQLINIIEEEVA